MKAVVTLSSKNQIAIPKAARKMLAIGPGDQFRPQVDGAVQVKQVRRELRGCPQASRHLQNAASGPNVIEPAPEPGRSGHQTATDPSPRAARTASMAASRRTTGSSSTRA